MKPTIQTAVGKYKLLNDFNIGIATEFNSNGQVTKKRKFILLKGDVVEVKDFNFDSISNTYNAVFELTGLKIVLPISMLEKVPDSTPLTSPLFTDEEYHPENYEPFYTTKPHAHPPGQQNNQPKSIFTAKNLFFGFLGWQVLKRIF